MRLFLKARHWQLFVVMFAIPFTVYFVSFAVIFFSIINAAASGGAVQPIVVFYFFKWFPFLILLFFYINHGWFWSVGVGLQRLVPQEVSMKVRRFKWAVIFPMVYLTILMSLMSVFFNVLNPPMLSTAEPGPIPDPRYLVIGMLTIFPLHLICIVCIFYSIYFVAKTIKTVELQKELEFSDFAGECFMVWFNIFGIWILQPKINKMAEQLEAKG